MTSLSNTPRSSWKQKKSQSGGHRPTNLVCCYVTDLWKPTGVPYWSLVSLQSQTELRTAKPQHNKKSNIFLKGWQRSVTCIDLTVASVCLTTVPACGKKAMAAGWLAALLCCGWSWKLEAWGLGSLLRGSYAALAWLSGLESGWQVEWLSRIGVGREAGKKMSRCSLVYLGVVGVSPADCKRDKNSNGSESVRSTCSSSSPLLHLQILLPGDRFSAGENQWTAVDTTELFKPHTSAIWVY